MVVTTPDKVLLKILWDVIKANGRPPETPFGQLAYRLKEMRNAGVAVYQANDLPDLEAALKTDARLLEELGFLRIKGDSDVELTRAGELLASTLEFPEWVQGLLNGSHRAKPVEAQPT